MNPDALQKALKAIGISSGIALGIVAIGAGFIMYKNFLESKKIKLEIERLKQLNGHS